MLQMDPPLPMIEISKRLNHPNSTLLSRFPDLCCQAVDRYRIHVGNRRREFWEEVQDKLEKQLLERTPLSVAEVAREVRRSRTVLVKRFPGLCAELFEHWVKQRKNHWDAVEYSLRKSLESASPLRLKDIARQLDVSHTSLYKYFPELCSRIAKRYALYLRESREAKKESLQQEVKRIAMGLYEQGIYPSVREVEKHLNKPITLRSSKVALDSLRDLRNEFCISIEMGNRE